MRLHQATRSYKATQQKKPSTKWENWDSLVVQWLRIRLPVQGTRVQALVWKIPHAAEQLSPCATTPEPVHLEPVLCNKRSHRDQSPHTAMKSSPHSPQLEKARAQQQRPNAAKNKINKINKVNKFI